MIGLEPNADSRFIEIYYSMILQQKGTMKKGEVMMTSSNRNIFRVTWHLCGDFSGHRWIRRTKASDAELGSASE